MDLALEKRALFFVRTTRKSRKEKVRLEKMRTQERAPVWFGLWESERASWRNGRPS